MTYSIAHNVHIPLNMLQCQSLSADKCMAADCSRRSAKSCVKSQSLESAAVYRVRGAHALELWVSSQTQRPQASKLLCVCITPLRSSWAVYLLHCRPAFSFAMGVVCYLKCDWHAQIAERA